MAMENDEPNPLTDHRVPHKEADDTEQVYYEGSPLLRAEVANGWFWVLLGLVVITIPIVWWAMSEPDARPFAWWWFLVALVVGAVLILIPWLKTKAVRYKITNYRIDIEQGLISRRIDTLELWHVDDIKMHQSVLDRIIGSGTVTVFSSDDTTPELEMEGIPNPRPLFDALKQRIIAVKRQRGVIKMDVG